MDFLERELSDTKFLGIVCMFGFSFLIHMFDRGYGWGFLIGVLIMSLLLSDKPNTKKTKQRGKK